MLGSPILYLKGMRRMMFQLSGFYYIELKEGIFIPGPQGTTIQPLSGATLLRSHMGGCQNYGPFLGP